MIAHNLILVSLQLQKTACSPHSVDSQTVFVLINKLSLTESLKGSSASIEPMSPSIIINFMTLSNL